MQRLQSQLSSAFQFKSGRDWAGRGAYLCRKPVHNTHCYHHQGDWKITVHHRNNNRNYFNWLTCPTTAVLYIKSTTQLQFYAHLIWRRNFYCASCIFIQSSIYVTNLCQLECIKTHAVESVPSKSLNPFLSFSSRSPPYDHITQNR